MTIVTPDSALPAGRFAGWGWAGNRRGDLARMYHRWRSQDSFRNRAYGRLIHLCPTEMRGCVRATLAVAKYAACTAAEKAASPQALKDIGRILKDQGWERSVRPPAIIQ